MSDTTLCQTGETSCIACCIGVYLNTPKPELEQILNKRAEVLKDSTDPFDYQERIKQEEQNVHFCEFIGYLDPSGNTVGCIIHPAYRGIDEDIRNDSRVRRSICSIHECKFSVSFREVGERIIDKINRLISGMDWYTFSHFIRNCNK